MTIEEAIEAAATELERSYGWELGREDGSPFHAVLLRQLSKITGELPQRWISVKDRLPEAGDAVLFCLNEPRSDASVGWWTGKWTSSTDAIVMDYGDEDGDWLPCSHWMPLPEPPCS
jgi:hypothetical protein